MRVKELLAFIKERHAIYERRKVGLPKPWTKDPILQAYRFCNCYRELDTVTTWIRKQWREPFKNDPNIWFAMTVARLVNWPDSLYEAASAVFTGCDKPVSVMHRRVCWNAARFVLQLDARRQRREKVWSGAYIVSTNGNTVEKTSYIAARVLTPLWNSRAKVHGATLRQFHEQLLQFDGMGSFMAAQVVADGKYTPLLAKASDWWTWAAPGPGSLRGMSRVEFGDLGTQYSNAAWCASLVELQRRIDPLIARAGLPRLHAQDLQNCLCEFDKYERARLGQGRPRARYNGVSD